MGLLAELFRVNVETAPLIDVALGEATGHLVIDGTTDDDVLTSHLENGSRPSARPRGLLIPLQPAPHDRPQPERPTWKAAPACWGGPIASSRRRHSTRDWRDGCWARPGSWSD